MIELILEKNGETILIIVEGYNLFFGNSDYGSMFATLDGLQLSYSGTIEEFPDLKDNPLWRIEAIKRLKEKVKSYRTEEERAEYIIEDLRRHGFIPKYKKVKGFRVVKLE
jgi:hypothetical protein